MIKVREIDTKSKKDRELFLAIPFHLASAHKNWIPGLRLILEQLFHPRKNPYLKEIQHHFFIAEKEGKAVGRIALFGPGYWNEEPQTASIAFPDFMDDSEVAQQLFIAVENKAKELKSLKLIGPLNPNIHYDVGVQTKGFEEYNAALMGYNPSYYAPFYEKSGWKTAKLFESWELRKEDYRLHPALLKITDRIRYNPHITIRTIRIKQFDEELRIFYELYCQSFASHWGFVAPSFEEFQFIAADLRFLLKPDMGMVVEYDQQPIGFVLGIPDFYSLLKKDRSGKLFPFNWWRLLTGLKRLTTMRVMIAGMLPKYRDTGIFALLFQSFTDNLFTHGGITSGEIGWVMKGNQSMQKALHAMGASPTKEYTLFEKYI